MKIRFNFFIWAAKIKAAFIYIFSKFIKMKNGTRIYLGSNTEALDTNEDFDLRMNYTLADAAEPTAIKNSWSRTVKLPATKRNNRILGEIYNSDWEVVVNNFNPNTRVDYRMYIDSELVQTGYVQLDNIYRDSKGKYEYEMTFYGGLGDFFYNLSIDEDTGETKKLSDLRWGVKDADGNLLEKDREFDFKINKDFINENWKHLASSREDGTIHDFISFAPMYNGTPGEIDSAKMLVNTKDSALFSGITTMAAYNGYYMTELNDKMDEWATHDLRSYLQRPVVKVSKLMEAIANPENNGGYEVTYDDTFFDKKNVYYENAYMTLPLLNFGESPTTKEISDIIDGGQNIHLGGSTVPTSVTSNIKFVGTDEMPFIDGYIDVSANTARTDSSVQLTGYLSFTPASTAATKDYDVLKLNLGEILENVGEGEYHDHSTAIRISARAYDDNNNKIAEMKNLTISNDYSGELAGGNMVVGDFVREADGTYFFNKEIKVNLKIDKSYGKFRVQLSSIKMASRYEVTTRGLGITVMQGEGEEAKPVPVWFDGEFNIQLTGKAIMGESIQKFSDSNVTKQLLFNSDSDNSVLDFVLNYSKHFGFIWQKDLLEKKIKVWKRDTFYAQGDNIDLNRKIDYNKDVTITPLNFDRRFYVFRDQMNENYYSQMYKTQYSKEYGQKRVDTNYPFNDEVEEMMADSIFQTIPEVNVYASYNRSYYTRNGEYFGGWVANTKDTLISYNSSTEENMDVAYNVKKNLIGYVWYDTNGGNDWTNRPSCAKEDNAAGTLDYALLFYTGFQSAKDVYNNQIDYYITDDVDEMFTLNGNSATWLYTQSEEDINGNQIAIRRTTLPIFSRWMTDEGEVVDSWEWGTPVELYVRGISMPEDANIYGKFWKKYQEDQFNVNSRSLTCSVDMRKIKGSTLLLGNFYYFQNAIWVLSEINDYDVTSDDSVECKFIKVLNKSNYTDGQVKTN